jgi:RNA recognition motif-containing protein
MKNTESSKTLTASLPQDAQVLFVWIADPENLAKWHTSFCRSLRKENGSLIADSPRGPVPVRFIRDDRSLVLDLLTEVTEGIELTNAIRILSNGEGSEMVWTLVKPEGISDSVFHEQLRWAGSALQNLRKVSWSVPVSVPTEISVAAPPVPGETTEPLQAPSSAEVSSMPLSGKKLFIGNLSYDWSDDQLRAHFAEQGSVVTAEIARFRGRGGRSRGFGFVEMATEAEAQTAIEKLRGGMAGGREIIVRLAKSQEKRRDKTNERTPSGASATEPAEPGNERIPPQQAQRQRTQRPRRGARPRSSRAPAGERSYRQVDITNKNGYEIFPRRSAGSSEDQRPVEHSSPRSRSNIEPSPYMEDTGDIENRGSRTPRHRRRR